MGYLNKKIFITRNLSDDSPFMKTLTPLGYQIVGESMVEFLPVPFSVPPESDWIFFYSGNGVRFFFQQERATAAGREPRFGAMGQGTANALESLGKKVDFIGSGPPSEVAAQFLMVAGGRRVVFPRAYHSRRSIQQLLEGEIEAFDLVVYENRANPGLVAEDFEFLVFTSPLNVEAYFVENELRDGQKVISIGNTTGEALRKQGILDFQTAASPSEKHLASIILADEL